MNTLRQAVQEYLAMRRSLGYKLQYAGPALIDFVNFLEQQFGVKIRPGEITLKNFKTVNRMVDFIDRELAES